MRGVACGGQGDDVVPMETLAPRVLQVAEFLQPIAFQGAPIPERAPKRGHPLFWAPDARINNLARFQGMLDGGHFARFAVRYRPEACPQCFDFKGENTTCRAEGRGFELRQAARALEQAAIFTRKRW
jgi:hypothetical protein